ncbi:hypothetical protein N5I27_07800 [Acinetobacter johnsonii]|uniref:Uncharacterized protein n=1 Tax=Acinetobacter johnsonii TaxID=40214 RepID=A0AA42QPD9_ACIJO|nr:MULTISPECIES: hypothetical protein [Acinetobacter]MDH1364988.1 hypothetical protein [Acinetobacter johnsonii]MDH1438290.1 hypothetical protein [Acinetobacter johnsonii]UNT44609.1 hypothetical protein MN200_07600 [Acinetobacter sp. LUNF3]HAE64186.1 hypothetical protein [Acinetobacter johnsonii]
MLSKEDAEKMANEILQKEREKSQSKLAKKSSSIDRIYKTKNLAKVPQYQHILLFRQAESLAEDHPLYNKMWYGYLVLALLFVKYLFRQRESVSSFAPNNIGLFSFLILFMLITLYRSLLIRMYFKRLIQAYLSASSSKKL